MAMSGFKKSSEHWAHFDISHKLLTFKQVESETETKICSTRCREETHYSDNLRD